MSLTLCGGWSARGWKAVSSQAEEHLDLNSLCGWFRKHSYEIFILPAFVWAEVGLLFMHEGIWAYDLVDLLITNKQEGGNEVIFWIYSRHQRIPKIVACLVIFYLHSSPGSIQWAEELIENYWLFWICAFTFGR